MYKCTSHHHFPLNPVSFIDNVNEKNKLVGINKFVDIIAKYSNIGKKQQQTLKDATKEAFIQHKDGKHPSLKEIYDLVIESVGDNVILLLKLWNVLVNMNFSRQELMTQVSS